MAQTAEDGFLARAAECASVLEDAPHLVHAVVTDAHEGPVYVAEEDALYFTTLPRLEPNAGASVPAVAIRSPTTTPLGPRSRPPGSSKG